MKIENTSINAFAMKKNIKTYIIIRFGGAIIILAVLFSLLFILMQKKMLIQEIDKDLYNIIRIQKELFPPDFHDNIFNKNSISDEQYYNIVNRNNKLCKDLDLQYLWSVIVIDENIHFTTATSPDKDVTNNKHAAFFEIYSDPKAFDLAFQEMKPLISEFHDEWGNGRMILSPYTDIYGRKYCFGAAHSIKYVNAKIRQSILILILALFTLFLLFLSVIYFLAKSISEPIKKIANIADNITKDQSIKPLTANQQKWKEIFSLNNSIVIMHKEIQNKISALQTSKINLEKSEDDLRNQNSRLDKKVEERTNELSNAKEKSEKNEQMLKEAQQLAKIGNWELEIKNNKLIWSDEIFRIFGCKPQEFGATYEAFLKFIHPDDRKLVDDVYQEHIKTKIPYNIIHRILLANGEIKYVNERCNSKFDVDGNAIISIGTVADITENIIFQKDLQVAKAKVEESEKRFELVIRATESGIWDWNIKTNEEYFSPQWCEIIGYSFDDKELEHTYSSWANRIHKEDYDRVMHELDLHLKEDKPYNVDYRHLHKSGEYRWQNSKGKAIKNENGKAVRMVGGITDITKRKEAEQALKIAKEKIEESEEKYRTVAHYAHDWQYWIDTNGNFVYVSPSCKRITGYKPNEFLNNNNLIQEIIYPADLNIIKNHKQNIDKNGERCQAEFRIITKQKEIRWIGHVCQNVITTSGKLLGVRGSNRDITERKNTEQALKKSEIRFKNMFERHDAIMLLIEPETGLIINANNAATKFYGYSKSKLCSMAINDINMLSPEQVLNARNNALNEKSNRFDFQHKLENGDIRTVEVHSTPVEYNQQIILFSIIHDITKRKNAEQTLKESEEKFRQLFENMGSGVAIYEAVNDGADFCFRNINSAAEKIDNVKKEKIIGNNISKVFPSVKKLGFLDVFKRVWRTGISEHFPMSFYQDKRISGWRENYVYKLSSGEIVAIYDDITKRKQAEQALKENEVKLKESNDTKDKFFSIIAHDLRSPFSAILGFSSMLLKKHRKYDDEKREKIIELINDSTSNALKLLENLLTWSRSQSGRIKYLPEEFHLKIQLIETVSALQSQADKKDIKILDVIFENDIIFADKNMIATIFRNLISNAIKFTPKNGTIIISSEKLINNNFLEISVTDTGVGIPKDIIDDLFHIDKNTSTEGTENESGTGLGLILCKEFTEKHGGKIWVESELEKGSKFKFTMPLYKD